jgi:hypothetical protein
VSRSGLRRWRRFHCCANFAVGRGGTKGSLRKSGHFVAFRAEENVLGHCQPDSSQGHELETARKEVSVQKGSARAVKTIAQSDDSWRPSPGYTSTSTKTIDGSIVQYTDAWDDVRARNARARFAAFLVVCGTAINVS